jgi:hypothetical protein
MASNDPKPDTAANNKPENVRFIPNSGNSRQTQRMQRYTKIVCVGLQSVKASTKCGQRH